MAKRKRGNAEGAEAVKAVKSKKEESASTPKQAAAQRTNGAANDTATAHKTKASLSSGTKMNNSEITSTTIQVITGSYERVLHGFAATIPQSLIIGTAAEASETNNAKVEFSDTFLFNAHASAIRCLALSPQTEETSKVMLATGGTDERINLYSLSTAPPALSKSQPKLPSLHGGSITENPKNKELGSLLHHSSNIKALYFPTRSKLLSAAEDSTIAITRTRDWTALSTIKAPIPKPQGRPSGDTAGPGEVPSGINDFAVHPSMKLMVSVGKGEKCMRLWNLVTGKKAGVLNFGRDILTAVGEGRFGSGEGRRVVWDTEGEAFAVGFERGVVVFSIDSKPKAKIVPTPRTKIHQMHYLPSESHPNILLVSTEDGRVLLYDTSAASTGDSKEDDIPAGKLIAQIGGPGAGISGRVKDFEIVPFPEDESPKYFIVAGSSDGTVRTWVLDTAELDLSASEGKDKGFAAKQTGTLLGTYSTGTRITCLKAFVMTGRPDEEEDAIIEKSDVSSESEDESG